MRRFVLASKVTFGSGGPWAFIPGVLCYLIGIGFTLEWLLNHCLCRRATVRNAAEGYAMFAFGCALVLGKLVLPALRDTRSLCLPGAVSVLKSAAGLPALLFLFLVLLPGLALSVMGHSVQLMMEVTLYTLLGLVLTVTGTSLPRRFAIYMGFAFPQVLAHMYGQLEVVTALLLVLICALGFQTWRPLLAGDVQQLDRAIQALPSWAPQPRDRPTLAWSDWWFASHAEDFRLKGALSPVRVIRTFLGTLYAGGRVGRLSWRFRVLQMLLLFGFFSSQDFGLHWGVRVGLFGCLVVIWVSVGIQAGRALARVNGELAELALVPGLGDPRSQVRSLCRATLVTPLWVAAGVAAVWLLVALFDHPSVSSMGGLLLWIGASLLFGAAFMLGLLAARPKVGDWIILALFLAAYALCLWAQGTVVASWIAVALLLPAWLLWSRNLGRLEALRHPFLTRS
jgi:hypothetical protein